jgi:hypothetical protein
LLSFIFSKFKKRCVYPGVFQILRRGVHPGAQLINKLASVGVAGAFHESQSPLQEVMGQKKSLYFIHELNLDQM